MNITSKSRYALKILMDLAVHEKDGMIHRIDIAQRQGIPLDYMDQILIRLKDQGLIKSTRGRCGGYRLALPAQKLSVHKIFTAVEDAFEPVQCLDGITGCGAEHFCHSKDAWGIISQAIKESLSGIILSDLVSNRSGEVLQNFAGKPQECRAPRRSGVVGVRTKVSVTF